ncbi:hypothetical protein RchiOBHm_Chr2g0120851 [Rosa chinensis]|uniref:Uncharacterized protein n=1 Tax=Rosa chinensis TaxID=74649 RepID=A0A2P6RSE2_ROSCH|nr:hypothetical protein RchiOBHm_Chr2g0120851 [Rosa chinensis]
MAVSQHVLQRYGLNLDELASHVMVLRLLIVWRLWQEKTGGVSGPWPNIPCFFRMLQCGQGSVLMYTKRVTVLIFGCCSFLLFKA